MSFDYSTQVTAVVAVNALENAPGGGPPAQHACLDCGEPLTDRFCAHCGQPANTHRITLKHLLLHDLPHSVWHVDKGLFYTLGHMLRRPGATLRDYFAGRRTRHFRPISFLLLTLGVSVLLMSAIGLQSATMSKLPPDAPRLLVLAMERYMKFFNTPSLIFAVLIPFNAVWANWLARRARFNYAEHLLGQAFILGATNVITNLTTLLLMLLTRNSPSLGLMFISFVPTLLYSTWAYAQLLDQTNLPAAGRWLRGVGIIVLQTLTFVVACMALVGYSMFAVLRENPALMKELKKPRKPAAGQTAPAAGRR